MPSTFAIHAVDPTHPQVPCAADIVLADPPEVALLALTLAVQRGIDASKAFTWPAYGWLERARQRCDSHVLVVATRRAIAAWARRIAGESQPGPVQVIVFGPDELPASPTSRRPALSPPGPSRVLRRVRPGVTGRG